VTATDQNPPTTAAIIERLNLLPPYAVRTSITLGLPRHLTTWTTVSALSREIDVDPVAIRLLTDYLATLGLIRRDDRDRLRLTTEGTVLLDESAGGLARHWDMRSIGFRMEQAYLRLPEAARSRVPAYVIEHGRDLYCDVEADAGFVDNMLEAARGVAVHTSRFPNRPLS
jgi:hypothetical protein